MNLLQSVLVLLWGSSQCSEGTNETLQNLIQLQQICGAVWLDRSGFSVGLSYVYSVVLAAVNKLCRKEILLEHGLEGK